MDFSPKYLQMCLAAPKELTKPNNSHDQTLYCTYHNCLVDRDYDGVPSCEGMDKVLYKIYDKHLDWDDEDKELDALENIDDFCRNKRWIRFPSLEDLVRGLNVVELVENLYYSYFSESISEDIILFNAKQFDTLEQLLLAYLVKSDYQLVWFGKGWQPI